MKNYSEYVLDLKNLIAFNTVETPKADVANGAPFGEQNRIALEYFLSIAKRFGFNTINYDGYIGEVYIGEGEEVGIIGHLDVVPSGDGWNTDPFTLTEKDGYLYARGVVDDKAPLLSCLYALKEIKDNGAKFNRKIRLFVGCNEETGWKDIEYLSTKTTIPDYGFSPDGGFPVSYAEKGVENTFIFIKSPKNFTNIVGGTVINAVCGKASMTSKIPVDSALVSKLGLTAKGNVIESVGVSCHGSRPNLGVNALKKLFEYMIAVGEDYQMEYEVLFGGGLDLSSLTSEQGETTFSPNLIKQTECGLMISCDVRLPAPFTINDLTKKLAKSGLLFKTIEKHPPMLVKKDGWFVSALISSYNEVTGENASPVYMCGSTFARAFKYGCAFGPSFPHEEDCCHEANERVSIKSLKTAYEIYKTSILNLIK